jgi:broad specificity phosphatase PhoE
MKIYLIRHGESWHNHFYDMNIKNPPITDPPLTLKGKMQAYELKQKLSNLKCDAIISSPLTRALQTMLLSKSNEQVIITSLHTESMSCQGDRGTPKSVLQNRHKKLNFDLITEENWWYPDDKEPKETVKKRVELFIKFLKYLELLNYQKVAVIGHSNFFWYLLGRKPSNCEICEYKIPQNTLP